MNPWWFEEPGPAFFNRWSLMHLATGFIYARLRPGCYIEGLLVHTGYEAMEQHIFSREDRDPSMLNHVGDTVAWVIGMALGGMATNVK